MSKNSSQWATPPKLPETHYVSSAIYNDEDIFKEEQEKIFRKVWLVSCHESELPDIGDYRRYRHPAGPELFLVRGEDEQIRCFYNLCPHRGNMLLFEPSGNAKHIKCIFHLWSFNGYGECTDITRQEAGYGDRLSKNDIGLKEVKATVDFGGFVWITLNENADSLDDYLDGALDELKAPLSAEPLEVILFHRAIVNTNYKLWHDTNSELYHDFVHYHNRKTAMLQEGYWNRKYHCYKNGHASLDSMTVRYDAYEGAGKQRKLGWPSAPDNCHMVHDLFPGITYNLRSPVFRLDIMIPISANKVIIEYRGIGLKSDSDEIRQQRIRDHNSIWGPFGRNLHEDLLAVSGQGMAMNNNKDDSSYILHAREEDYTTQDEIGMRHFYEEWTNRMGRKASSPYSS